jgi:hypothetical protein
MSEIPPNDKMEPIEAEEVVEVQHEVATTENMSAIHKMLDEMIILSGEGSDKCVVEPSCPICMSPIRVEAEELWEQSHSSEEVKKLFKEKVGIKLSKSVIDNHMENHTYSGINELQKVEYLNRIKRLQSHNASTMDYLELALTALAERLMGVNSVTAQREETLATIEKMKSGETAKIVAQIQSIAKTRAALRGEMIDNGDVVILSAKQLPMVFSEAIALCETEGEKKIVRQIVNRIYSIRQS